MDLPPGTKHFSGVALSPDGTRLAIVTQSNTTARDPRLWVRTVGGDGWQLVSGAGPEIVRYPFWSPDSSSLAFFRDDKLVRADVPKFEPVVLCDAPDGRGGAWLDDGTLVFAPTTTGAVTPSGAAAFDNCVNPRAAPVPSGSIPYSAGRITVKRRTTATSVRSTRHR